ncbi:hypothetical protein GUJ93_ZPchr0008g12049 [Zizania palustris]|uniref:Uncharacterized protein n=1 Tax=Zizania palustris TaxID=103762 RepID=A0A8J5V514_ZIZPA|nr:hypothetical protein GUJ93_ZPchr0008g12049 [Zizania palustris]
MSGRSSGWTRRRWPRCSMSRAPSGSSSSAAALRQGKSFILNQEKLWKMLKDAIQSKPNIDVVKLHKSEGVVLRNPKYRQKNKSFRIKEYFYGIANDLAPHSNVVNFSDVFVYKIGSGHQAPRSALPIGAEPVADPTRLVANV